jgi:general stress protein 26
LSHEDELKTLWEKVKDIKVAMLTTLDDKGQLRSRPMYTQKTEFKDYIWFFTREGAPKVAELDRNMQVNISYANPDDQVYISISGSAQVMKSKSKAEQLWNPALKAWFPKGLDDPDLALIKINVDFAEYWDPHSGKMVTLFGLMKAIFSGKEYDPGEDRKLVF